MASGFPGRGGDGRRPVGAPLGNNGLLENLYQQQQLGGGLADPAAQIGYRRPDFLMIGKRSLADYRPGSHPPQPSLFQQQQQGLYMRSVKQRTGGFQNHALSPISPLSASIDLCSPSDQTPSLSTASSARYGVPIYPHQQRHQPQQPAPVPAIQKNPGLVLNPGSDNSNKLMTLRELEKQLLDDDDEDDSGGQNGGEEDAVSAITNSDWSETFQDLISPKPNPTITNPNIPASTITAAPNTPSNCNNNGNATSLSPASSSSSCSSSRTPPPPPPPAAKLAQLISEAAAAVVDGKSEECAEILSRLAQIVSPTGDPEQRLGFYMLHALRCRLSPSENPPPIAELYSADHLAALHALYDLSPYFKYALLSSNLIILDVIASAIRDNNNGGEKKVVHIVDFDIGNGKQYMNLIRALISQIPPNSAPLELKITAVETEHPIDKEAPTRLKAVGETLMKLVAEKDSGRISLRFNAVTLAVGELTRESLSCDVGEALVVNFAFRLFRVPDESVSMDNLRDALLRRVRAMEPRVVTLVEQELNANTAPFASRVTECAAYYGSLIDSLELGPQTADRGRVEEALGRKMSNAVACEGRQRVERCEVYGKWRARMSMAGFKPNPVGSAVAGSMWDSLSNPARGGNPNLTVKEDKGGVCFGWMGKTLTVASAWR